MFFYYYIVPLVAFLVYLFLSIPCVYRALAREICSEWGHVFANGMLIFASAFVTMLFLPLQWISYCQTV